MVRELNDPKALSSCLQVQRDECILLLFDVMVEDGPPLHLEEVGDILQNQSPPPVIRSRGDG